MNNILEKSELPTLEAEGNNNFKIEISDLTLRGIKGVAKLVILWRIDFEFRDWGLKGITVFTHRARLSIYTESGETEYIDTHILDGWTVEDQGIDLNNELRPFTAEVDYNDKSIIIQW